MPARIQETLRKEGIDRTQFAGAMKTAFKPNDTIPILWIVLADAELLLCSTHRTRGIWRRLGRREIDSARTSVGAFGGLTVLLILADADDDLVMPMPKNISAEAVQSFLGGHGVQVIS
jgi:hypothetical protein